jgi:hypothetical protein
MHCVDWIVFAQLSQLLKAENSEMIMGCLETVNITLFDFIARVGVVDDKLDVLGFFEWIN